MKKFILILLLARSACEAPAQSPQPHEPCGQEGQVVRYQEFSLRYSEENEQPYWVAYTLVRSELLLPATRKSYFKEDKNIITGSATLEDYKGSNFDRGHLSRAEYNKKTLKTYKESFLLSNISPQIGPGFNRTGGLWYKTEEVEKKLCEEYDTIYCVSGPVFDTCHETIGPDEVTVPACFFKVLVFKDHSGTWQGIGFLLPHEPDQKTKPEKCMVTIKKVEEETGLDFNCEFLTDEERRRVETEVAEKGLCP